MKIKTILIAITFLIAFACKSKEDGTSNDTPTNLAEDVLIPKPVSVTAGGGTFELAAASTIYADSGQGLQQLARYFADRVKPSTGFGLKVSSGKPDSSKAGIIYFSLSANDAQLGEEGYTLSISRKAVMISANRPAGIFRGIQTLLQLLPDKIESSTKQEGPWKISTGTIRDFPSYAFRSSMLDVSRHFFGVDDIKRYIDLLAFYKLNTLHLHLSDDQGWRIEIKSWPNLTTHGGSTQVGGGQGGYYTQEQYKDIVKYAQDRFITIIPEIDMPGHTNAALASYGELNCNDKATALYTKTEVGFSSFCVHKEVTYKFIDDVVRELAEMTPGPYIHLGGDESHATKKDDYIYFVNRVQQIPKKYGKKMIGWEEISQSKLDSSTVVQYWANAQHAIAGVQKGAKIIFSPATKVYLDMKYDTTTKLGLMWAALIEIDSSYMWSPATRVPGIPRENILGVEAPLWSETVTKMDDIEYMVFPRLAGIAEIAWSPDAGKSWDEYKVRLGKHGQRMKAMGIDYYSSKQVPWTATGNSGLQ